MLSFLLNVLPIFLTRMKMAGGRAGVGSEKASSPVTTVSGLHAGCSQLGLL